MRAFFFFAFLFWLLAHCLGCSTMPAGYGGRAGYGGGMFLRGPAVPVPPSNVWFVDRPSMYCVEESPLCMRVVNNFKNLHGRCWVDGRAAQMVARGGEMQAWVPSDDGNGLQKVGLFPPGGEVYVQGDTGIHPIKCRMYAGPVRVLPDGSWVFEPTRERRVSGTFDSFPTRAGFHEYRLEEGGGWDRITRRY